MPTYSTPSYTVTLLEELITLIYRKCSCNLALVHGTGYVNLIYYDYIGTLSLTIEL
jgi:hypothetical protein